MIENNFNRILFKQFICLFCVVNKNATKENKQNRRPKKIWRTCCFFEWLKETKSEMLRPWDDKKGKQRAGNAGGERGKYVVFSKMILVLLVKHP
jgi:hypothetical protein